MIFWEKGLLMKKDYEIALSYAHKDKEIAEIIEEELQNIFYDGLFMDELRAYELANASIFKDKLRNIFQRANYSIILYSDNYNKAQFTGVEMKEILNKAEQEKEPHYFIINVNDCELDETGLKDCTYMGLQVSSTNDENRTWIIDSEVKKRICEIIYDSIKIYMIKRSIIEKKKENEYSLNIQTSFGNGNLLQWLNDYDWNILGKRYIDEDGRKIKKDTTWEDFWEYIKQDFLTIKRILNKEPDVLLRFRFNCHLSIAYKLGQIYGDLRQASGNRNLELISSNRVNDKKFPLEKKISNIEISDFCIEYEGNNDNNTDIVCIISITPRENTNILEQVKNYLKKQEQDYYKICLFQKQMVIGDSNTLESMAEYLRKKMEICRKDRRCIHLFANTSAPLMFVLGARTIFSGIVKLYEYDMKEQSYEMVLEN